jgi:hypothetical protein
MQAIILVKGPQEMTLTIIFSLLLCFALGFVFGVIAMALVASGRRRDDEEGRPR